MHPEQKRIFQTMTPDDKLRIALRLYYSARELKEAALRDQNPGWSEEKIKANLIEIFLYART
ncbi:MAG: hypothetical protein L6406_07225 [Desulfobacterales bacterium]|jgi:hypothetical protein|nr:hypothetical protein [Pseudomonadota bacterium]MCG2775456.1 hypothetical protein [Desulfobacterales bacterium]